MPEIGKKIVVLGVSASGKSTFSRKLGEKTGLSVTHIDALMWKPGWEYIGEEATARLIKEHDWNKKIIRLKAPKEATIFLHSL